jgi:WD40 repeat protein
LASGGYAPWARRAAGGPTASVRLWDLAAGRQHDTLPSQGYAVAALAFTADSLTLATGGEDTAVRLWDVQTGRLLRELRGFQTSPISLAFTPDGRQLLAIAQPDEGCYEACGPGSLPSRAEPNFVRLWDTGSGQVMASLNAGPPVCGQPMAVLSPNGRQLAADLCDGQGLWIGPDSAHRTPLDLPRSTRSLIFSPDGNAVAGITGEGRVALASARTGHFIASARPAEGEADWLVFLPNGRLLVWGESGGVLRVWHARQTRGYP